MVNKVHVCDGKIITIANKLQWIIVRVVKRLVSAGGHRDDLTIQGSDNNAVHWCRYIHVNKLTTINPNNTKNNCITSAVLLYCTVATSSHHHLHHAIISLTCPSLLSYPTT